MADSQEVEFSLNFVGRTYRLFGPSADWREETAKILHGETYPLIPFVSGVETIFDIGARLGMASIFFKAAYPMARIYSFEPDPTAFSMLRRNVSHFEGIRAFNFGLSDQNVKTRLPIGQANAARGPTGDTVLNDNLFQEISVRDVLDVIYANEITQIDLLKLNTKGYEMPVLRQIKPLLSTIKVLYAEYHSEDCRREIDSLLKDTHVLYSAKVTYPHRGEFCFISRDVLPSAEMTGQILVATDHSLV
jgi:FkbM family methyltransferase